MSRAEVREKVRNDERESSSRGGNEEKESKESRESKGGGIRF